MVEQTRVILDGDPYDLDNLKAAIKIVEGIPKSEKSGHITHYPELYALYIYNQIHQIRSIRSNFESRTFDWGMTREGGNFWNLVILDFKFELLKEARPNLYEYIKNLFDESLKDTYELW